MPTRFFLMTSLFLVTSKAFAGTPEYEGIETQIKLCGLLFGNSTPVLAGYQGNAHDNRVTFSPKSDKLVGPLSPPPVRTYDITSSLLTLPAGADSLPVPGRIDLPGRIGAMFAVNYSGAGTTESAIAILMGEDPRPLRLADIAEGPGRILGAVQVGLNDMTILRRTSDTEYIVESWLVTASTSPEIDGLKARRKSPVRVFNQAPGSRPLMMLTNNSKPHHLVFIFDPESNTAYKFEPSMNRWHPQAITFSADTPRWLDQVE